MAFGGYKFAGYLVDNSQYQTSIERCAAIHAARIRAFMDASAKAGNPWIIDPAWKDGEFDIDFSTGALSSNPGAGCIHDLIGYDGNSHGYLTYFKRDSSTSGYYAILTTDQYSISYESSTTPTGLNLLQGECIYEKTGSSSWIYGPAAASCFHAMSLEPFGRAPSGSSNPDYMYIVNDTSKSTRLQSIGSNYVSSSYPYNVRDGYVNISSKCYFGYAIKGDDLLIFSSFTNSSNPWNSIDNTHVSIMSLNAFSEMYNPNDVYGLLNYEVKNNPNSSSGYHGEQNASYYRGEKSQILGSNGQQVCSNNYNTAMGINPIVEVKTKYNPSGTNTVPFCGVPFFLHAAYGSPLQFGTNQIFKGSTKPELLCANLSSVSLSYTPYSTVQDGSLMFLYGVTAQSSSTGLAFIPPTSVSYLLQYGNDLSGYYNTYIGWDSENPDISTDASWTSYTPDVSPLI